MPKNTRQGPNVTPRSGSAHKVKCSTTRPLTAPNLTQQHTAGLEELHSSKRKAAAAGASMQQPKSKKQRQQQQTEQLKQMPTLPKPNHSKRQPGSSACQQPHAAAVAAAGGASDAAGNALAATAETSAALVAPAAAAYKDPQDDEVRRLFRSWAWKREHRPNKDRFHRPYVHSMSVQDSSGVPQQVSVTIKQQKFSSEGFASTVWDSSIVVAKYLEKLGPGALSGKRCLDLSAGCGLVGVVMAKLGAEVTLTDLAGNLPLLQHNCRANGVPEAAVVEHRWGEDVSALKPPFNFIVACDVMYVHELVQPLLQSLRALSSSSSTTVLVAHGRNRPAEPDFKAAAAAHFDVELVPGTELDDVYQCSDVDVLRLKRKH